MVRLHHWVFLINSIMRNRRQSRRGNIHFRRVHRSIEPGVPIFVHIPKTAGRSFQTWAKSSNLQMKNCLHTPARFVKEVLEDEYSNHFSFCFCRNPYERFVSACGFNSWHASEDMEKIAVAIYENNVDWASYYSVGHYEHFFTQKHFVTDFDDETCIVDYIARYEDLEMEIENLADFGVDVRSSFKYKKPASSDWRTALTGKAKEYVVKIYKGDFEYFDYDIDDIGEHSGFKEL